MEARDLDCLNISRQEIRSGYEFASTSLFFTYNERRLSTAFGGLYLPREAY
jgi:hypothetical protein